MHQKSEGWLEKERRMTSKFLIKKRGELKIPFQKQKSVHRGRVFFSPFRLFVEVEQKTRTAKKKKKNNDSSFTYHGVMSEWTTHGHEIALFSFFFLSRWEVKLHEMGLIPRW